MKTYKISFSQLNFSVELVLTEMGYGKVTPEPIVVQTANDLYTLLEKTIQPRYAYKIYQGEMHPDSITIGDQVLNTGTTITPLLDHSYSYAIFAATVGSNFDTVIEQVNEEKDILKSYILDIMGTCLVEKAGDLMEKHLEQEIQGTAHTHRFSPGYCGWLLTEQIKIFQLLEGNPCDIQLSEVCLMRPIKSISGIVGIGDNVNQKQYGCNFCELETCYKRKRLENKAKS